MFGITVALAAFIAILQLLIFESSYDKFHSSEDDLYRVVATAVSDGKVEYYWAHAPKLMGEYAQEYPGVLNNTNAIENWPGSMVGVNDKIFVTSEKSYYVAGNFLDVLNFEVLHGNTSSLANINNCVITESFAKKLFGQSDNVVGKSLRWEDRVEVNIAAVMKDLPENSSIQFEILLAMETFPWLKNMDWENNVVFATFLQLDKSVNIDDLSKSLTQIHYDNHEFEPGREVSYKLQSIRDMHFNSSEFTYDYIERGNLGLMQFLFVFSIIIIVISLINYINISSTKLFSRTKEVGIRKLYGAVDTSFVKQFFLESFIFNLFCTLVAFFLLSIPQVSNLFSVDVGIYASLNLAFFGVLVGVIVVSSLLASAVPSVFILSHGLVALLKGEMVRKQTAVSANSLFLTIQLFLCVGFIAFTLTIVKQFNFMTNKDLGVTVDNVLLIPDRIGEEDNRSESFRSELLAFPEIESVSTAYAPGDQVLTTKVVKKQGSQKTSLMNTTQIDYDYLETFGIELIAGRNISKDHPSDSSEGMLINKSALEFFDFDTPEEALNERISLDGVRTYNVVGVIDDFHQVSLKNKIVPSTFVYHKWPSGLFSVKLSEGTLNKETIAKIQSVYNRVYPEFSFDYQLLDEKYNAQYSDDLALNRIIAGLSIIAVVLCCLGLWTMTEFSLRKKSKEIAMRKVLGARIWHIFQIYLKTYGIMMLIASLLALPATYYISQNWLGNYAYRIQIGYWFFVLPILILLPFILASIIRSIYIAATRNPIESIRNA
jgi:putative ABC transport system permease protein